MEEIHYVPRFESSIYRRFVLEEKEKLRKEIIKRIKQGLILHGLSPMVELVYPLTIDERYEIINYWKVHQSFLEFWYYIGLLGNDIEQIKRADAILFAQNQENLERK